MPNNSKSESANHPTKQTKRSDATTSRGFRTEFLNLSNNPITLGGLFLVAVALTLLLTFFLFALVTPVHNPYVDIIGYLVLPGLFIGGLAICPIGIWWTRRRRRRTGLSPTMSARFAMIFMGVSFFLVLPILGVSGYEAYHFTETPKFCSDVCHEVMAPQATTYKHSAHARVACAECHIGSGAGWLVKSKVTGLRQVYATLLDTYSRPIPPAITELRPARDTCERCHWPKKFFGAQLREIARFAADEDNTRHQIKMLLKTGGGDETTGRAEGIHLHMALTGRIDYVATDDQLQTIPWVRYTDKQGNQWTYRSDDLAAADPPPDGIQRTMDCMDCHNRPAHKFLSPDDAVNVYLETGKIDRNLPFIKRQAMAALAAHYPSREVADAEIERSITEYYRSQYEQVWKTSEVSVRNAVEAVQELYSTNFFPLMKVNWRTYPDNIGHFISPGCFRCHDGKHVDQRGQSIKHQCDICHTFLNPVEHKDAHEVISEGQFIHPYELEGIHQTLRCDQCHSGGHAIDPTCAGCHTTQSQFRNGELAGLEDLQLPTDPMADTVACDDCHDLSEPATVEAIAPVCMDCHDDEPERFEGLLASWKKELDADFAHIMKSSLSPDHQLIFDRLRKAGPYHNIEATRRIIKLLTGPAQASADIKSPPAG